MKIIFKYILVIATLIVLTGTINAQSDSIDKKADSLNAVNLLNYNMKVNELNQQRIADSIYKSKLELELSSLNVSDRLRKESLEKEIQEIKNKDAARIAQKKARIDSLRQTVKGYPVEGFFNDTLFFIYNSSGGFTAKDRAGAIGLRIKNAAKKSKLIDAALRCQLILKEPIPFVLQTSLNDFFVSYQINAYTLEANMQAAIYSLLHQHIQDVCNERGIEIMSPHYRSERDGNKSTIPANYLPKEYKSPAFNVTIKKDPENPSL